MKEKAKSRVFALSLICSLILTACFGPSAEQNLTSAKKSIEKKDNAAAIVLLKSALQADPEMLEARYLLAEALFTNGDIVGAAIEAKKLAEVGYSAEKLVPLQARLMFAQGKAEAVLTEFAAAKLNSNVATADLLATRALAYGAAKQFSEGQDAIKKSLELNPDNVQAQLIRIRLLLVSSGPDSALAALDELIAKEKNLSEAWQLRGELLTQSGKRDEAIEAFKKAAVANKKNIGAYAGAMDLLIAKGDLEAAAPQLKAMRDVAPKAPVTHFYGASLAMARGNLNEAHEEVLKALASTRDQPRVLLLAGVIELKRGALLEANNFLSKLLTANPDDSEARKLLAQTQLRQDEPAKAIATLQPLLAVNNPNLDVLRIAAESHLRQGDAVRAQTLFAEVAKRNPGDARAGVALAISDISRGNRAGGISTLRKISEKDASPAADYALLNAHMATREFDDALKDIDALERKLPEKERAVASNLRGRVELARGNQEAARKNFESAVRIDPIYYPAVASLVWLDSLSKNFSAAESRLQKVIDIQPKNEPANMALVTLREQQGASGEELVSLLKKLIAKIPRAAAPRLKLIGIYAQQNDLKSAFAAANEATAALPDEPEVWGALGSLHAQSGAFDQAVTAFNKQISLGPNSPELYMPLAGLYALKKDLAASARILDRALAARPDFIPAQAALATIFISKRDFAKARRIAQQVQSQHPSDPVGTTMLGDVESNQKQWDAAAASYRDALSKGAGTEVAVKLHLALTMAAKPAMAGKAADEWLATHPRDVKFLFHLGDTALMSQDWVTAEQRYRQLLAIAPTSPAALNNMAWALVNANKPGAVEYAEQATKLAPKQSAFWDTYARAAAGSNDFKKAVEAQKNAIDLDQKNQSYRLSLARYYLKLEQKAAARQELERLVDSDASTPLQQEAKKLLLSAQ